MAKCKYESNLRPDYKCPEDALPDSKEDFCIFHERSKDKDIQEFNAGIEAKMEKKDYDFTGYYFPSEIDFRGQKFEDIAHFDEAEFRGKALFDGAGFQDEVRFDAAKFQGDVKFFIAKFQGEARFDATKFQANAWFYRAQFRNSASFGGAKFQGKALFDRTKFRAVILFTRAQFQGHASFDKAEFQGMARFSGVKFHDSASFDEAKFEGEAEFFDAEFQGVAWFVEAKFQTRALFGEAQFQDWALFERTKFHDAASFDEARFAGTVSFKGADFPFAFDAEVAYRKAKISYQREGDYAEAGYYYLLEMRARRKAKKRLESAIFRKSFTFLRNNGPQILLKILQPISILAEHFPALKRSNFVRKIEIFRKKLIKPSPGFWEKLENRIVIAGRGLERFFMDWTCGYGEKPLWVIRSAAILILAIAMLYWLSGGIILRPGAGFTIREPGFLDSVYFSVVTFTTLGYGDWYPDPNHWIRYFAMAEAFTGAFMMALFVLCFARKWMR